MTTKAGEQPTITQAQYGASYRRDLDRWVIYEQTSEGSIPFAETYGYDKERVDLVLSALRTTSLAAQDGAVQKLEQIAKDMEHATAGGMSWISEDECREFVWRIRKAATTSLAAQDGLDDFDPALCPSCHKEDFDGCDDCGNCLTCCKCGAQDGLVEAAERALNYLANTEDEFGISLGCAEALRAALSAMKGEAK